MEETTPRAGQVYVEDNRLHLEREGYIDILGDDIILDGWFKLEELEFIVAHVRAQSKKMKENVAL